MAESEVMECVQEVLKSLLAFEGPMVGCVLKPTHNQLLLFSGDEGFEINSRLRRQVVPTIKVMAGMNPGITNPQVGYILLSLEDGRHQFVVQNRMTPVGEELMIRVAATGDPTFPPVPPEE